MENSPSSESKLLNKSAVQQALRNDEFELYYQPIVNLATQQVEGAESLIRWHHPTLKKIIGPDKFIPIVENDPDLIHEMTIWTLKKCFEQIYAWQNTNLSMNLNLNLFDKIVHHPELLNILTSLLPHYDYAANRLGLEISECMIKNLLTHHHILVTSLQKLGFRIVIDDFELSHASISDLISLSVIGLKINRSHVLDLNTNEKSQKIVRCLIKVAHELGIKVCATGIENAEIWQMLINWGCDCAQGYYICRPVSIPEFNKWVGIS